MSATLDAERISAYFDGCPTLAVPGRTFPVDVHYLEDVLEMCDYTLDLESPYARTDKMNKVDLKTNIDDIEEDEDDVDDVPGIQDTQRYSAKTIDTLLHLNEHKIPYELLAALVERLCSDPAYESFSRAILVFLPGMGEIRECMRHLSELRRFQTECQVHVLHSSIASDEQTAAFAPPPQGMRKIVLATNMAETGITIPDITCVIDSGRHREMRYDEKRKISRLVDCFIARSNAKQRRGRAGRVQHGICFHLFTRFASVPALKMHFHKRLIRHSRPTSSALWRRWSMSRPLRRTRRSRHSAATCAICLWTCTSPSFCSWPCSSAA